MSGLVPVWVVWAVLAEPGAMVLFGFVVFLVCFCFLYFVYISAQLSGLVPVWVVWAVLAEPGAMVLRAFCGRHGKFLGLSGCEARKTLSMGQEGENKLSINDISKRRGYTPCWVACLH